MLADTIYRSYLNVRSRLHTEKQHFAWQSALRLGLFYEWNRIAKRRGLPRPGEKLQLRLNSGISLFLRPETTDYRVFRQIFVEREYSPLDNLHQVQTIIDCGANVGYSSLYFLNRFPEARVIAIEPDPANALVCEQNLKPYGSRALVIRGAIWPQRTELAVVRGDYGDGGAWATQVKPLCGTTRSSLVVQALGMSDVLNLLNGSDIDLLKIDIERSEIELFGSFTESWLPHVRNIAIELHDEQCREVFYRALDDYDFALQYSGELTILRGLCRKTPCHP
jgi:FkbM family methyltransferase